MARGYPGAFGRMINAPYIWLPLCAIFVARPARLAPPVPARPPRPARGRGSASGSPTSSSTGGTSGSRSRSPTRRCSTCSGGRSGSAFAAAAAAVCAPRCRSPSLAVATVLLVAGPRRSQRRRLQRDRRGLLGRDRRRPDRRRGADLRQLPRRRPIGGHLRAGRLLRLRPVRAGVSLERHLGRPARRARRRDLLRPRDDRRALPARPTAAAGVAAAPSSGCCSRFAWAACPYTAFVLESNTNDALVALDAGRPPCSA